MVRIPLGSKSFVVNFLLISSSGVLRQVSTFIVSIIIANRLGDSTLGVVTLAYSLMLVFIALGDFGFRVIGWRDIARDKGSLSQIIGTISFLKFIFSCGAFLVLLFCIWSAQPSKELKCLLLLYGVAIFFNLSTFDWVFLGLNRIHLVALLNILSTILNLVPVYLIVYRYEQLYYIPIIYIFSNFFPISVLIFIYLYSYGGLRPKFGINYFRNLTVEAFPIGASNIIARLSSNFSILILGMCVSSTLLGQFRIPQMLFVFLVSLSTYFSTVVFSTVSSSYTHARGKFKEVFTSFLSFQSLVTIPISVGGFLLAKDMIHSFVGLRSDDCVMTMKVLFVVLPIASLNGFLKEMLPVMDGQRYGLFLNIIRLSLGIGLGVLFINFWGIVGMGIAMAFSECACFCLAIVYLRKRELVSLAFYKGIFMAILASLAMAVFIVFVRGTIGFMGDYVGLGTLIISSGIVYFFTLYLMGCFKAIKVVFI